MRPLRLSIEGLRSYRKRVDLDFSGAGLLAIVGDTGSGKSSILEAITYALYNATTWDAAKVKDLISDGAQTMSVALEFEAEGKVYQVHRSTSRTAYPPSVHKLECLSDPSVPRRDGDQETSEAIERLVGMSWKAFKSAVILPQGQFQALLQASPSDRTRILEGIFRLDAIRATRAGAEALAVRAEPLVFELEARRASLPPDPDAARRQAEARRDEALRVEKNLTRAEREVKTLDDRAQAFERRGAELRIPAERLVQIADDPVALLGALKPVDDTIGKAEIHVAAVMTKLEEALASSTAELQALETAGQSARALYEARGALDRLDDLGKRIAGATTRIAGDEADLEKREAGLKTLEREARAAETALREAGGRQKTLDESLNEALRVRREAEAALRDCRRLGTEAGSAAADIEKARKALMSLEKKLAAAGRLEKTARDEVAGRRAAHEAALRSDAAAHAAHGLHPGDDCPVCRRKLPASFTPPAAPDQERVRQGLHEAEQRLEKARSDHGSRKAETDAARTILESKESHLQELQARCREAEQVLRAHLPEVDLEAPDNRVLEPLARRSEEQEKAAREGRAALEAAQERSSKAKHVLETEKAAIGKDREIASRVRAEIEADRKQAGSIRAGLPPFLEAVRGGSPPSVEEMRKSLTLRIEDVASREAAREKIRRDLAGEAARRDALARRRREEVELPRRKAMASLERLQARLNDAREVLGQDPLPPIGEEESLEAGERAARAIAENRRQVTADLLEAIEAAEKGRAAARDGLNAVLSHVERRDLEELRDARVDAMARRVSAEKEIAEAVRQIPIAADLDRKLERGRAFVAALRDLQALLTDGRFVRHVVDRRQKNLLAVASEILGSMTAGRYGFAPDFLVIDRVSNQPRSTRTLSGGESFLASLALALGLVEIAARAGGRLDALFLDEGFGALDANALDEALSALETRAKSGKLVAVVSHLKAVAERIETVLLVKRSAAGSELRWALPRERDEMVEEELESGLLS